MIGQTLAHYKILEKIGSGGMGDVYLAEDTKLDRKIALKVLPPELAENEERRARFTREAKAIAALNHPNIVTVYSVEQAGDVHFITMELVKGKTLTELLPSSGLSLAKFFEIAIPLADAVAAAHQEGITHRDLKPDNVMKGDDGRIKVLDFGLAKPQKGMGSSDSDLPTEQMTQEGRILGTVAYMSPEQAEGKPVDALTDIFSLGIVFYEMLTASRPFHGETSAAILSSIIKDEPVPVRKARAEVPREISRLVQRCLAKEPRKRIQTALDVHNELEELKQELASGELEDVALPQRRSSAVKGLAVTTVVLLVGQPPMAGHKHALSRERSRTFSDRRRRRRTAYSAFPIRSRSRRRRGWRIFPPGLPMASAWRFSRTRAAIMTSGWPSSEAGERSTERWLASRKTEVRGGLPTGARLRSSRERTSSSCPRWVAGLARCTLRIVRVS